MWTGSDLEQISGIRRCQSLKYTEQLLQASACDKEAYQAYSVCGASSVPRPSHAEFCLQQVDSKLTSKIGGHVEHRYCDFLNSASRQALHVKAQKLLKSQSVKRNPKRCDDSGTSVSR